MQDPPPVPWNASETTQDWRLSVKDVQPSFSTNTYTGKGSETAIAAIFTKCDARGEEELDELGPTNLWYDLTQSFFTYSDSEAFWAEERGIPFLVHEIFRETLETMVRFGDVSTLDVKKYGSEIIDHFLNEAQSMSLFMQLKTNAEEPKKPVSTAGSGKSPGNSSNADKALWSPEWMAECSNKRLGQELLKDIATFKLVENGLESRRRDWSHFLAVVGPSSKLEWDCMAPSAGWKGDSKENRVEFGLSVAFGTSQKAVSEALVLLATKGHGEEFPPVYTQDTARAKWKSMHGDLKTLETTWIAVDPTYKKTFVKSEAPPPPKKQGKRKAAQIAGVSTASPRVPSNPALETRIQSSILALQDDMVEYINGMDDVKPDQVAIDLAGHLTSTGTADPEEVAKFLHVYAEEMMRKAKPTAVAVPVNAAVASARADLLEDTLVAVIRQERGVMNSNKPEELKLFQFLAEKLMARGNPAVYTPEEWKAFKDQLQKPAFW